MRIINVRHRGLRRFIERDDESGLPQPFVEKVRNIVSFLQDMAAVDELKSMPLWRVHRLSGDQRGRWSLTVRGTGGSPSRSTRRKARLPIWISRIIIRSRSCAWP